jgi:phosphate:Na+ symporter
MVNTTSPTAVLAELLTGVFLLLYGVRLLSYTFQRAISGRIQRMLTRLLGYPFTAFVIGVIGTALMQSSSAMTSLLIEQVDAALLPLSVAIVMMLGANVGSTLVVQLLALHVTDHAVELLGLGVAAALFTHYTVFRRFGRVLFAFTLIAFGLAVVEVAGHSLGSVQVTVDILNALSDAPLVMAVIAAVLTMLLNSSAASVGLVFTLTAQGALQLSAALALILGINVGSTLIPMFVSLRRGTLAGRRLALARSGTKLLGVTCLLPFVGFLAVLLDQIWPYDFGTQVALAHMGFNLVLALIFVPFSTLLARLVERLLPSKSYQTAEVSVPRILDPQAIGNPEVAQGLATRETLRMAGIVTSMFELSMRVFDERSNGIQKRIRAIDDQIDELDTAIKGYLTQLDEEGMTEEQVSRDIALLTIVSDLEAIGDVITHRFLDLAYRRSRGRVLFSKDGWEDLSYYHRKIREVLQQVIAGLATHNPALVNNCLTREAELKRLKRNLHVRHISELRTGVANSAASSAIYLDLLDALSTVLSHVSNIACALKEAENVSFTRPLRSIGTGQFKAMNTQQLRVVSQANLARKWADNDQK